MKIVLDDTSRHLVTKLLDTSAKAPRGTKSIVRQKRYKRWVQKSRFGAKTCLFDLFEEELLHFLTARHKSSRAP